MNTNGSKASNVLGGKTARACDSCLLKRARWFCAADDAFLCQSCDAAVHSANQLASRHERVRLETSSCKLLTPAPAPAWHTKKARTPRNHSKSSRPAPNHHHHQLPLVPEINSDEAFPEEHDEQLFSCRVPDFDDGDFCVKGEELGFDMSMVFDDDRELNLDELLSNCDDDFTADVESLLGTAIVGGGNDAVDGLLDENKRVKIEEKCEDDDENIAHHFDPDLDVEINWDFDCTTNSEVEIGDAMKIDSNTEMENEILQLNNNNNNNNYNNRKLRLNYEAVIAAWDNQGSNSPWTDGIRPQLDIDEFMGAWYEDEWGGGRGGGGGRMWREKDEGREARVSRYREKRRNRLFSKKIRYEVRKLNAEKRPRMKGRFVKRTTFLQSSLPYHHHHQINK